MKRSDLPLISWLIILTLGMSLATAAVAQEVLPFPASGRM
jgi:hypothetical protein